MILLIDSSTPICHIEIYKAGIKIHEDNWQADRSLAEGIYTYLEDQLRMCGKTLRDISGIGVFKGPGSFTGLRIGAVVCNTIASEMKIPIVGVTNDEWQSLALERIHSGESDEIVLPFYGRDARITTPMK